MVNHFANVYTRREKRTLETNEHANTRCQHFGPSCTHFGKFYARRKKIIPNPSVIVAAPTSVDVGVSRRSIRRRRTLFNSLFLPFSDVRSHRNKNPYPSLHATHVHKRMRSSRSRRTSFSYFTMPITSEIRKRLARQAIDTERRRKSRAEQTGAQRAIIRALDSARRRKSRSAQTSHERAAALSKFNLRRRELREGCIREQRPLEGCLNSTATDDNTTPHPSTLSNAQVFQKSCRDLIWVSCATCHTSFPGIKNSDTCAHCSREIQRGVTPLKFSAENLMDPGIVPIELSRLTTLEQILIARIHPMMSVYRVKGQQYKYSGNVINFVQDVNSIAAVLPFKPGDLSALLIVNRTGANAIKEFRVRREYVRQALFWLKQNHIYYRDIIISETSLGTLPDDDIPADIPYANEDNEHVQNEQHTYVVEDEIDGPPEIVNQNVRIDDFHAAGTIALLPQPNQQSCIKRALHVADVDHTRAHMHITNDVIDEFSTSGYISMVFPSLFPYGNADLRQARPRKLSPSEYFQYLMKYFDGRFAKDSRFRYFAWNSISRWRALSLGDIYVKKNPTDDELSIEDIKTMVSSGDKQLATRISYYSKSIRGTRAYWFTRLKELTAMVKQLGAPTIFFTLSAADLQWPELYDLLDPSINHNSLSGIDLRKRRAKLLNDNPCVVAWFFQARIDIFLKEFLMKEFEVIDHWYRFEWQNRGSGHVHGFLWLKDAPDVIRSTTTDEDIKKIIEYFDKIVCTENPDMSMSVPLQEHPCARVVPIDMNLDTDDNDYASLVNWVMRHSKCGSYCLRLHKTTKQMICRFRYPFDVLEESSIVEDPPNSKIFRFLGHRNDPLVCSHNRKVLQTWRANMDWSPVLSVQSVIHYIAKYASKAEPASKTFNETLQHIVDDLRRPCPTARSAIKRLLIKTVSERDISAQEVCHLLMGYPLSRSSRKFVLLNITEKSMMSSAVRRSHGEHGEDVVGTDPSFVIRYMTRPPDYDNLSLLQMAKKYYFSKERWHKYKVESIVRIIPDLDSVQLDANSENYESHCRHQVLLHHHYRSLPEAKGEYETWAAQYVDLGIGITDIVHDSNNLSSQDLEEDEYIDVDEEIRRDEWMLAASMGPMFDSDVDVELGLRDFDISHNWGEGLIRYPNIDVERKFIHNHLGLGLDSNIELVSNTINVPLTDLSDQQRTAHDFVLASLRKQITINMIITGGAGTGKSTLINAIVHSAFNLFHSNKAVRIMAPTGVAAFNIGGATIHHDLAISAERKPSQPYVHISGDQCIRMQEDFKDTKLLIIDEYSMLGRAMLANVDLRCRDIYANNKSFGGVSILLVGDMRQLPPVFDSPLYSIKGSYMQQCGTLAYSIFDKCIQLSYIFRQAGEEQRSFREALNRLSDGTSTIEDWHMFKTRDYSTLAIEEVNNFRYALRLFPTKKSANEYNRERLIALGRPIARIVSKSNCEAAAKADPDQAKGLENILCISVGARVMLRANLATQCGLVNGAMGMIVDIVYSHNCKSPSDLPLAVMVDFDSYRGTSFRAGSNLIPIPPITSNWKTSSGISCQRTQLPLVLCWAITIHKSQGLTLDKAVIDIGEKESLGLTFVALSRTRRLQDLAFNPMFTYERLQKIGKCEGLKWRRKEEERLRTIEIGSCLI